MHNIQKVYIREFAQYEPLARFSHILPTYFSSTLW